MKGHLKYQFQFPLHRWGGTVRSCYNCSLTRQRRAIDHAPMTSTMSVWSLHVKLDEYRNIVKATFTQFLNPWNFTTAKIRMYKLTCKGKVFVVCIMIWAFNSHQTIAILPSNKQPKWRLCKNSRSRMKPLSGVAQPSARTCTHCISTWNRKRSCRGFVKIIVISFCQN